MNHPPPKRWLSADLDILVDVRFALGRYRVVERCRRALANLFALIAICTASANACLRRRLCTISEFMASS